jgi:hypothetical protein
MCHAIVSQVVRSISRNSNNSLCPGCSRSTSGDHACAICSARAVFECYLMERIRSITLAKCIHSSANQVKNGPVYAIYHKHISTSIHDCDHKDLLQRLRCGHREYTETNKNVQNYLAEQMHVYYLLIYFLHKKLVCL